MSLLRDSKVLSLGLPFALVLSATTQASGEAQALAAAKQLFERFVALADAFDERYVDLYADTAVIRNRRVYPTGQTRTMTVSGSDYKAMIRKVMLFAKLRGDRSTYSDVSYVVEGRRVRIVATRFSELKRYSSAYELVVAPSASGEWLIVEEHSESRP